jgi:anti-anti-sigma factor
MGRERMARLEAGAIRVRAVGATRVLGLRGEHDLSTVEVLAEEIERQFRDADHVIVDLGEAAFVDSTVICALAVGHEHASTHAGCSFAAVAPRRSFVGSVFDVVDLRSIMPTYETLDEALRQAYGAESAVSADLG